MQCVYPPTRIEYCMRDSLNAPHRHNEKIVFHAKVRVSHTSARTPVCQAGSLFKLEN